MFVTIVSWGPPEAVRLIYNNLITARTKASAAGVGLGRMAGRGVPEGSALRTHGVRVAFGAAAWRSALLTWSIVFLVIAVLAALLGFSGVAGTAAWIAQVLFILFVILFIVFLVLGRRLPPV